MRLKTMLTLVFCCLFLPAMAEARSYRIVALGDSLTAGYGLQGGQDYATKLQEALIAEKYNVVVNNAGVSGDTTAGGLARVDWAISSEPKPDLVIVALGGNDMIRAIPVTESERNLRAILQKLKDKKIQAIVYGIKAPNNLPAFFRSGLEKMYVRVADDFDVPLYPFFLKGVALDPKLNIADGYHPNEQGIAVMVKNTLPLVTDALDDLD